MISTSLDIFGDYGIHGLILIFFTYVLFWFYKEKYIIFLVLMENGI